MPRPLVGRARIWALVFVAVAAGGPMARLTAFNYVVDGNGTWWGIQDDASPFVDTGSVSITQAGPGQGPSLTTTINGFGGLKVRVDERPAPRFNGELMRGFGLRFDGHASFRTTRSVALGGVRISRTVFVSPRGGWGRWLDTFTNTTGRRLRLQAAFGGQSGMGASGPGSSVIVQTSSGDATVTADDTWVEVATPTDASAPAGGPQATVIGTVGRLAFAGDWLNDSFTQPLIYGGHRGNFQAYVHALDLAPGESRSLLHFLVLGRLVTAETSTRERAAVEATAGQLAATPDVSGLTPAEVCSIDNFSRAALVAGGWDPRQCPSHGRVTVVQPAAPAPVRLTSRARFDVTGKTIADLRAAMESGRATSHAITQAYLDRIAVYDQGPFGFHAYEVVASDALQQADRADAARRRGQRGGLLGIPFAIKNLYDTVDMPTTNGSLTFAGFRPAKDAFQVARLRDAGAVILGKAALEEYATSGFYSNDAWGQVWNVFQPSRSALGSSGGSASAVAASLATAALGSQTGDSLYAPASAASLVTLRGTDGLESGSGVMPLTYLTDFGGVLARSVSDLADVLNVVVAVDPADPETQAPGRRVPDDWRTMLDAGGLRGKRIGYIPSTWIDPFGTTTTIEAEKVALTFVEEAGGRIVEMGSTRGGSDVPPSPSSPPGDIRSEGWRLYIDSHPELAAQGFAIRTAVDVNCSQRKVAYVRADAGSCGAAPSPRLSASEIQAWRDYRRARQAGAKAWMDAAGVDAIIYPGLLSDISLNDGGGPRPSFGRRDTPSAANGIPTIVVPVGRTENGQPVAIQLLGRAWDDDKLVAMAYALELVANAHGRGHIVPASAPPLPR